MPIRRALLAITALLAAAGCGDEEAADLPFVFPVPIDTGYVTVTGGGATERLLVEIARTPEQQRIGLGLRPRLDPGSGMLFRYDSAQGGDQGYWMLRMRIPIDIAFVDSAGSVLKVFPNVPICDEIYPEGCPSYAPGAPYWSVLETNPGWFAEKGLGEGAVVRLEE